MKTHKAAMAMLTLDDFIKEEFWHAVSRILLVQPNMAQRLAAPELEKMWKRTREVWIILRDRQTDTAEENSPTQV